MTTLTEILNNPEEHYPGNFDTPQRANALLTGLCQDAANEIENNGVIIEYHESLLLPTVLGCLDIVKAQLLADHMDEEDNT